MDSELAAALNDAARHGQPSSDLNMPHYKFTATKVNALVKAAKPGWHGDGGGLWLQTTRTGTASWVFRYRAPADGRARVMGLGPLHTVSLGEARDAAALARKTVFAGQDPIGARAVKGPLLAKAIEVLQRDVRTLRDVVAHHHDRERVVTRKRKPPQLPGGSDGGPLLTIPMVTQMLQCSRQKLYQLHKDGLLDMVKFGSSIRIKKTSLHTFIANLPRADIKGNYSHRKANAKPTRG